MLKGTKANGVKGTTHKVKKKKSWRAPRRAGWMFGPGPRSFVVGPFFKNHRFLFWIFASVILQIQPYAVRTINFLGPVHAR